MSDKITLSGAELAILSNRFGGINKKMANTLLRSGRSGVLNRARDFSVCTLNGDNKLLHSADAIPVHTMSGPDMMIGWIKKFHPEIRRGDAFMHNSPYHGNSHAGDLGILIPIIDDEGIHRYTVCVKAHQADIGNSVPATLHATARDVYEEGALIFPGVLVQRDFKDVEDIIRMCRMRIRVPDQFYGDLLATIGAARIGEKEILALGREVGWDRLKAFEQQWFDYSEKLMIEGVRSLSAGQATAKSTHDAFPGSPAEGIEVEATVTVDPDAGYVDVDFTKCQDCLPLGLNLSEATSRSAAMMGVFNSIDSAIPKNAGSFSRIRVHLRENAIVGIPRHPTSTSVATTNIADHATNCVQAALATISEGAGMAETGYGFGSTTATISGIDPRTGKAYINFIFFGHTAGAASGRSDRWLTLLHVGNGGLCYLDGVELSELHHPLVFRERRLLPDTEGAGKFVGAGSIRASFTPMGKMDLVFASDGTDHAPQGVRGGLPSGKAGQFVKASDGTLRTLDKVTHIEVGPGDEVIGICCGGGGYGDPKERDRDQVKKDLSEGWITAERAASVYGLEQA